MEPTHVLFWPAVSDVWFMNKNKYVATMNQKHSLQDHFFSVLTSGPLSLLKWEVISIPSSVESHYSLLPGAMRIECYSLAQSSPSVFMRISRFILKSITSPYQCLAWGETACAKMKWAEQWDGGIKERNVVAIMFLEDPSFSHPLPYRNASASVRAWFSTPLTFSRTGL